MFDVWWAIQLLLNYMYLSLSLVVKKIKIGERLVKLQAKRLFALCAMILLKDEDLAI